MGIETFPRYRSSFINHQSPAWDPCATLEITNPDRGCLTCVGYAPSQRRRCRNPILKATRDRVFMMLEALAYTSPHSKSVESQLEQIAALSLCRRYHQDQVYSVVGQWLSRISLIERPLRRRESSQCDYEDLDTHYARPKATRGSNWQSQSSASYASEGTRRKAEQAEQQRQEREREACAEQERQKEKLRQQAAQRRREELQRQAREKAEEQRKAWDQAWKDYMKGWAVFKAENEQQKTPENIPWPVKSGCRADITETNVKMFFEKASPDASVPAIMFKTMSMENIKWHPDKISPVFGGKCPEDVALICRVVIRLRATAQDERNNG